MRPRCNEFRQTELNATWIPEHMPRCPELCGTGESLYCFSRGTRTVNLDQSPRVDLPSVECCEGITDGIYQLILH